MKVISFLGIGVYSQTSFCFEDQCHQTRFFPAAVAKFTRPDLLLVCATPAVREHKNLADLQAELDGMGVRHQVLPIPDGHSEADLWAIFDIMTAAVDQGEQVIFDITHSFRSLPMLAFLAVAYLKTARGVNVRRVFYGAHEARDQHNHSPVFDLTPFVGLLDWLAATNRFVETGDGGQLASLLRAGIPSGLLMGSDLDARRLGKDLQRAAKSIEEISLALRVTRPYETMQAAASLEGTLSQAMPGIRQRAKPFSVLADQIAAEYGQFALDQPASQPNLEQGLWQQLGMIEWYIEHNHYVQAVTLSREWIVSLLALHFGAPLFNHTDGRGEVEQALNNAGRRTRGEPITRDSLYDQAYASLAENAQITRLWSRISEVRNDIAHVGMRPSPMSASKLRTNIVHFFRELDPLGRNLLGASPPKEANL